MRWGAIETLLRRLPQSPPILSSRSRDPAAVRRTLSLSVVEGVFAEVVSAASGGTAMIAWGLHLNVGPAVMGVLTAFPFLAQLFQLPAAWLTSVLGHRRAAFWTITLSRQLLWPLVFIPFLGIGPGPAKALLVTVAAATAVLGVLGNNAWTAWMAELVPSALRGRYFGRRTARYTISTTISTLLAGALLDSGRVHGRTGAALSGLALIACLAGLVTTWLLWRQHDPAPRQPRDSMGLSRMIQPLFERASRRLLAFQVMWNAAIGLSGAFFTVFMLKDLRMGFTAVALYATGINVFRILAGPLWGRAMDRVGIRPVLVFCSLGLAILPMLWLFPTANRFWPYLAVDLIGSGILCSGHDLGKFALPLATAPRQGRSFHLAAFSAAAGIAYGLASSAGGLLAANLPAITQVAGRTVANLQWLFLISALLRLAGTMAAWNLDERSAQPVEALMVLLGRGTAARLRALTAGGAGGLRRASQFVVPPPWRSSRPPPPARSSPWPARPS